MRSTRTLPLFVLVVISGCTTVQPYDRGTLARLDMAWEPDSLHAAIRNHTYFSKEASSGSGSASGGGCGCN